MPPTARASTGWLHPDWSPIRIVRLSSSTTDITDELFTMLRYVSEVEEEGQRLATSLGSPAPQEQIARRYKKVRAFIRQAETYYRAAQKVAYRSSSLLYYYAFLNLAKAVLEIRGLAYGEMHGLVPKYGQASSDLKTQLVRFKEYGIFPALYRFEFGAAPPKTAEVPIDAVLARVSEITYQYEAAGFGARAVLPHCKGRGLVSQGDRIAWANLAIPKTFDPSLLPEPMRTRFFDLFEEVELDKSRAREHFEVFAAEWQHYACYQTQTPLALDEGGGADIAPLVAALYIGLDGCVEPKYVIDRNDFVIVLPHVHDGKIILMREYLSIYIAMFYLGMLVRYRPDYLDDLLGSKAAWILESFVNSAPLTALRAFVSKITGTVYAFTK